MPPTFDPIPTARLRLRPFEANDLDDFLAYGTRPDVVRYLSWAPRDRAAAEARLASYRSRTRWAEEGDVLSLAIEVRDPVPPRVVGEVMLGWRSRDHRQGELGVVLHPDAQGHGFAHEAGRDRAGPGPATRGP